MMQVCQDWGDLDDEARLPTVLLDDPALPTQLQDKGLPKQPTDDLRLPLNDQGLAKNPPSNTQVPSLVVPDAKCPESLHQPDEKCPQKRSSVFYCSHGCFA